MKNFYSLINLNLAQQTALLSLEQIVLCAQFKNKSINRRE